MLTFSVNIQNNEAYILKVKKSIDDNIQYFKKFNGEHWEEAVHRTFITAVANKNEEYSNIDPYIKNLARNILKTQNSEKPYDMVTEDGEVSYPFLGLVTNIDDKVFVDSKEIQNSFKELYLMYTEEFLKLKQVFKADSDSKFAKSDIIKNPEIKERIGNLSFKYGSTTIFYALFDFLRELSKYTTPIENTEIRTLELKVRPDSNIEQIPDIPLIKDTKGNYWGIDKNTLTMDIDPDYISWDTITNTACDIMKIDISPLMNYMYEQVFVQQGVHTKHITWCDDMYKLTTPGGQSVVNLDRDKFLNLVRIELILNLISARFNTIIAVSPDSVYIKPTRMLMVRTIRLQTQQGKIIDLPIEVHLKKRH